MKTITVCRLEVKRVRVKIRGRAERIAIDLRADIDRIVGTRTGFTDFADLLAAKGNYRPSIYLGGITKDAKRDLLTLIFRYNDHMEAAGDPRRAWPGDWELIEDRPSAAPAELHEIECAVCGRLEFGARVKCEGCGWPIRETPPNFKPYGYDLRIEIKTGWLQTGQIDKHFKGDERTARRRAKNVRNFSRVLAVRPLSETQWIGAYGEGRM